MTWYEPAELRALGLRSLGDNVQISTSAKLYRPEGISIGSNSRIDDFVTLTAGQNGHIEIGEYVHIAAYCMVEAPQSAVFGDYSGLAARVTVYGSTDSYRGDVLTNPCVPMEYRHVFQKAIYVGKHAVVGTNCVILPGAHLGDGCSVAAMSLIMGRLEEFSIYGGVPAKRLRDRSRKLLELEKSFRQARTDRS